MPTAAAVVSGINNILDDGNLAVLLGGQRNVAESSGVSALLPVETRIEQSGDAVVDGGLFNQATNLERLLVATALPVACILLFSAFRGQGQQ
jgi:O-acetylhomoserine/O-acetylserine sulfhydrylase-like pyridoxal-dependent enzyme